ncbi:hypothetical protein CHLNCDRAFT_50360 [Chlorella variabilis]|uniref:Uncharacterized protein n=1 Tax=Chlorella variabilis TaxID=554065 RepID=E1Z610_CHLVA|nr:hypothetical protein CHLNCDRAFT_50360 [Chlorella variabilis]EFN58850.1 hypothetical protein CHLNCDRAFT_50360 [Chlorella variabilis]|eukprot:XP_005850952.1 hypothetical protein CHLNCDRAFT_50360 [Chlorella variabilis]
MDFDDDLDSLLDLENEIAEEGTHKRSLADLQSQQDAARCLADPPGGKRARVDGSAAPPQPRPLPADDLDDELLALAAAGQPSPQHTLNTYRAMGETEEQGLLLALAADSQPSMAPRRGGASYRAFTTTTGLTMGATEEQQQLLALAAPTQPSQSQGGGGASVAVVRPPAATSTRGAGGGADDDDFDLDELLDELLDEELQEQAAARGGGGGDASANAGGGAQPGAAAAAVGSGQPPAAGAGAAGGAQAAEPEFLLPARQYVPPAREVYRISGASLAVTAENGERVYCQLEAPQPPCSTVGTTRSRSLDVAGLLRRARGGLLSDPISTLLAAVEQDQYDRAVAETAAAAATASAAAAAAAQHQPRTPGGRRGERGGSGGAAGRSSAALWVKKYAPKGYIDLLSDEQINREVVRWLKGWDPCVFGTAAPPQRAQQRRDGFPSRLAAHGGAGQQQPGQGGGGGAADPLGRPEHKIILIAGPPGSVMGQRRPNCVIVDEIDGASGGAEGRSGIAALLKIVAATGAKGKAGKQGSGGGGGRPQQQPHSAASGGDSDSESEGEEAGEEAGRGAAGQRGGGGGGSGGGRRGGGAARPARLRPLMRPIICICNDLYAPALRPLRDVARVFHFKKPQAERLAQRLRSICAAEGLACEKSTLRLLVERTECDIRSCLNTLQARGGFLAKKQSVVRQADLQGLRVGHKDMTKGAFAVWTELLQKKKSPGIIGRMAEGEAQRVARLYGALQDFGEGDLVVGGMHENVLGLRYFDMALQRTSAVLNQLGDADAFLRACHRRGEFALLKYVPAPLLLVSGVVAGPDRPQLQWPRAAFDCQRRAAANAATLQSWMLGMSPAACAATSRRSMVLEVLPALMHIAAPALRPVSLHLYSPAEQEVMRQLVDTLLGYNLRYCLDPAAEEAEEAAAAAAAQLQQPAGGGEAEGGQRQGVRGGRAEPPLRFRPAVHCACLFPGMPPKGKLLPAAVRQTISHEADMEAIRRAEASRRSVHGGGGGGGGGSEAAPPLADANCGPPRAAGVVPLTLAERMKAAGTAASVARRQAAAPPRGTWLDALKERRGARGGGGGGEEGGAAGGRHHKFPVLYRFHEGYTNAVKRPVLMRDLLG